MRELRKEFVGPNSEYYIPAWDAYRNEGTKLPFNKAALTVFWFFYRKMYLVGSGVFFLTLIIQFLVQSILVIIHADATVAVIAGYTALAGWWIFVGFRANRFYFNHAERKIRKLTIDSPGDLRAAAARKGGVGFVGMIIPVVIFGAVALLFLLLTAFVVKGFWG